MVEGWSVSFVQLRGCVLAGDPGSEWVSGLGLRDRWLLVSDSLEESEPEESELECLTLPPCVYVCWADSLLLRSLDTD